MQEFQNGTGSTGSHKLNLVSRERVQVTGVIDVVSFDGEEVLLETIEGMLQFKGNELQVKRLTLDKGEIDIYGKVNSMIYSNSQGKAKSTWSIMKRLFN
ncbi:MAG: sporulation protein YabP [Lachnoclostridium sp.]|jgi:sporulation protein YabP|nr:sporulation protein YabP [Lachnoclostridium sp.]